MIWYRIFLAVGLLFAIVASMYVMQYPCPGLPFAILTYCAALIPTVSGSRTGALLGSYGGGMSSLGVYIFITSILFGPGMGPPNLFYRDGPEPSNSWQALAVCMFWLGTAMALRGIILGVRDEKASTRQSETGENDHRGT